MPFTHKLDDILNRDLFNQINTQSPGCIFQGKPRFQLVVFLHSIHPVSQVCYTILVLVPILTCLATNHNDRYEALDSDRHFHYGPLVV